MCETTPLAALREELRALGRSIQPWDASQWLRIRKHVWDIGHLQSLPSLLEAVEKTTQQALKCNSYKLTDGRRVQLSLQRCPNPVVKWFGRDNVPRPLSSARQSDGPLFKFWAMDELEAALAIAHNQRPNEASQAETALVVNMEISQFTANGAHVDLKLGMTAAESCLALQSDFSEYASRASQDRGSASNMRDHLTAVEDPYILVCPGVTVFRGQPMDGFPFLNRPVGMDLILTARSFKDANILLSKSKKEHFEDTAHYDGLLQRLDLIALAALSLCHVRDVGEGNASGDRGPALVLGLRPATYPKHALAMALTHWQAKYAGKLSQLIVACGCNAAGEQAAQELSCLVNEPIGSMGDAAVASMQRIGSKKVPYFDAVETSPHQNFLTDVTSRPQSSRSTFHGNSKANATDLAQQFSSRAHTKRNITPRDAAAVELRAVAREMLMARRGSKQSQELIAKLEHLRRKSQDGLMHRSFN